MHIVLTFTQTMTRDLQLFHERTLDQSPRGGGGAGFSPFPLFENYKELLRKSVIGMTVLSNTKHWIKIYRILFSSDSSFRPF